ncbi:MULTISPECIES: PhnD/SsuA/transferrin family substrate-binding protein [Rhodomicrobium]|uniref:substrate-binding domain-containing protein n=1 Tax=Rhodomicrobium TaxID=1068 RepID=UPI000B4B0F18|nr:MULTISPECIES: PhnD/SsuA/transferrin family substrate-binding protein [Rhodomicrobium]
MPYGFAPFSPPPLLSRRAILGIFGSGFATFAAPQNARAQDASRDITLGLTPVFLNNDLELLAALKTYLELSVGQPVKLVLRRTYEEITSLLVSGQLDAAWICGYPFVAFRNQLELVAVPVWRGKPLYQSYIIAGTGNAAASIAELRGGAHAFSDPNSNSGYLVTAALLAEQGARPEGFFGRVFFTYGHRNVVRAVASGLADSGSVDGYVWEVMTAVEPAMTANTRVVRKSEWLGFPPIATTRTAMARGEVQALRRGFVRMAESAEGQRVLKLLHLDGFAEEPPALFDAISAKADLVKRLG